MVRQLMVMIQDGLGVPEVAANLCKIIEKHQGIDALEQTLFELATDASKSPQCIDLLTELKTALNELWRRNFLQFDDLAICTSHLYVAPRGDSGHLRDSSTEKGFVFRRFPSGEIIANMPDTFTNPSDVLFSPDRSRAYVRVDVEDVARLFDLSAEKFVATTEGTITHCGLPVFSPHGTQVRNGAGVNVFSPGNPDRGQPQSFAPGLVKGAFYVQFDGQPLTWTVQAPGGGTLSAVVSSNTQACSAVVPKVECIDVAQGGNFDATFSYSNSNGFDLVVPVGAQNRFSPSPADRGQPSVFKAGNVAAAFKARFANGEILTWSLLGRSVQATSGTDFCPASQGCTVEPTVTTHEKLDATALELSNTTIRAANELAKVGSSQPRVVVDARRAKRRAADFLVEANALAFKFPEVMTSCPVAPDFCAQVDNQPTINGLASLYRRQFSAIRRIAARSEFRTTTKTRGKQYVKKARTSYQSGSQTLNTIPRFNTECL